jgi:hemerythrin-like domain-containing protein
MKAIEILMEEHRVIERAIAALERAVQRLEQGDTVAPSFFVDSTDFIQGFADGCHHQKEEGVLFKALTAAGMPTDTGPIAVMLHEHEEGRRYARGMREAAQRMHQDADAVAQLIAGARSYAALLREHIHKEDNVLFPMAETIIPHTQQAGMETEFAKLRKAEVSEGLQSKYHALVEQLERQAAS